MTSKVVDVKTYLKALVVTLSVCEHEGDVMDVIEKLLRDIGYYLEDWDELEEITQKIDAEINASFWEVRLNESVVK